jgi:tetratricopeptide (TPR) repeat protein
MRNFEKSKLIYLLSALPSEELDYFRDYLHSPIFNDKEEPRRLYAYIVRHCLKRPSREIDDAKATAAIWPGKEVDTTRLNKVKNGLMNLLAAFWEFQHWQRSPASGRANLLHRLNDLGDESYFDQYYRKIKADLERLPGLDLEVLQVRHELEFARLQHEHAHDRRSTDNNLAATRAAMEKLVHGHVLKIAVLIANQQQIVGAEMPQWIAIHVANLTLPEVVEEPLLEIYFHLYHTMAPSATLPQMRRLKDLLVTHAASLSHHEAFDIHTGTINNFSRFGQRTKADVLEDVFALYQSLIESVVRPLGRGLNRSHFKNIVMLGARLGKFDWVEAFLKEGVAWLEAEEHAATTDYNQGVLYFYNRQYVKAERFLNRILADAKDVFYAYDARLYLLMCFYETNDTVGMESLVHSFRMLLERNDRISEQHKNNYLAFIRVFRKALGTPPNDQLRMEQLRTEVEQLTLNVGRVWLLEKIAAMEPAQV